MDQDGLIGIVPAQVCQDKPVLETFVNGRANDWTGACDNVEQIPTILLINVDGRLKADQCVASARQDFNLANLFLEMLNMGPMAQFLRNFTLKVIIAFLRSLLHI